MARDIGYTYPEASKQYFLRDIDAEDWKRFQAKARLNGRTAKEKLLQFIHEYGERIEDLDVA